ncbi:MAG TPA: non-ribosomal peptide synthetase [Vicinamibacterales bacterium]|nr:non-ribosomal peptide synthetase [Vicinamibacterales bacterium]
MSWQPVHEWFARTAAESPDSVAIERGAERITYAALQARAAAIAAALRSRGLPPRAPVIVLADDVAMTAAAILGVLRAGAMFVPLDPRITERRLQTLIAEIGAAWFAVEPRFAPLAAAAAHAAGVEPAVVDVRGVTPGAGDAAADPAVWAPDDPCYVYFTSGSTGQPKGIVGRLKAVDHFIRWEIATFGLQRGVRVSQLISPSFDAFLRDIFTPLCAGGTVCAPESPDVRLDGAALARFLDEARVNLVHCVPSLFRTILAQPLRPTSFPALRHVLLSGEPLLPVDVERWCDLFGSRIQLVNLYGPSETTMTKFFYMVQPADRHKPSIPIGVPMEGASAIVVDDAGRPCARGAVGEIYIRTPYRSLGYYGREDLTRAVFVQNPFSARAGDLVYRTGDLGRVLEDGNFELRGRRDHQVKIRGERVELGAVENALRGYEGVRDVAVVDREDGSGTKFLCAYVVAAAGVTVRDLMDGMSRDLPSSMVPTAWVMLDELPRTDSGKLDRGRLPAPASEARPAAVEGPRTPLETQLAALFADVLRVPAVGINESFFELGGHSLLATQLVARARALSGIDLPIRVIFDEPSVAGLARYLEAVRWARGTATAASPAGAGVQEVEL